MAKGETVMARLLRQINEHAVLLQQSPRDEILQGYLGFLTDLLCDELMHAKVETSHLRLLSEVVLCNPKSFSPRLGELTFTLLSKMSAREEMPCHAKSYCLATFLGGALMSATTPIDSRGIEAFHRKRKIKRYFQTASQQLDTYQIVRQYQQKAPFLRQGGVS